MARIAAHLRLSLSLWASGRVLGRSSAKATSLLVVLSLAFSSLAAVSGPGENRGPVDIPAKRMATTHAKAPLPATFTRPEPRMGQRPTSSTDDILLTEGLHGSPVMFVENVGQFPGPDAGPRFVVWGAQGSVFLARDAIWVTLLEAPPDPDPIDPAGAGPSPAPPDSPRMRKGVNLRLDFMGANPHARLEGFDRLDATVSYFTGDDPGGWHADVPVWGGVRYVDLYPGTDLEITSADGEWAWRLVGNREQANRVPDGRGEARDVKLRVAGADMIRSSGGRVCLETAIGTFTLPQLAGATVTSDSTAPRANLVPVAFSRRRGIDDSGETIHSLVPQASLGPLAAEGSTDLLYSTYLGGSGQDYGESIAVDSSGMIYVTGYTDSADFPASPGAFQTSGDGYGWGDVFVAKIDPSQSGLQSRVYSTYLDGGGDDQGMDIAVDGSGAAYVTGSTNSYQFPTTTSSAYQPTCGPCVSSAFFTKLNASGTGLLYSTYLGGGNVDFGDSIAVDAAGFAYLTGHTASVDFPITAGAYDSSCGTDGACNLAGTARYADGFVAKLDSTAAGVASLVYSTYLGGQREDYPTGIAVNANGEAHVTGGTKSSAFPVRGAYQATCASCSSWPDAFLTVLNAAGSDIVYSTFFGGSGSDGADGVGVDATGAAYITGDT